MALLDSLTQPGPSHGHPISTFRLHIRVLQNGIPNMTLLPTPQEKVIAGLWLFSSAHPQRGVMAMSSDAENKCNFFLIYFLVTFELDIGLKGYYIFAPQTWFTLFVDSFM